MRFLGFGASVDMPRLSSRAVLRSDLSSESFAPANRTLTSKVSPFVGWGWARADENVRGSSEWVIRPNSP